MIPKSLTLLSLGTFAVVTATSASAQTIYGTPGSPAATMSIDGKPKPEMEQRAIQMLQGDPQMRKAFFDKVSAPIVNKMFECGMIP